jgi:hypothetical protein
MKISSRIAAVGGATPLRHYFVTARLRCNASYTSAAPSPVWSGDAENAFAAHQALPGATTTSRSRLDLRIIKVIR